MKSPIFFTQEMVIEVGPDWYDRLKRSASESVLKRARLCLHHRDDDLLHEMVIVFHRDTLVQPHRHHQKTESYHLIFGELDIMLFDDDGGLQRIVRMGTTTGKSHVCRLNGPVWHSVIVRSEYAAVHEVTNGPFRPDEA